MAQFFLICLGGAIGSGARFAMSAAIAAVLGSGFPFGTITVNILGSFLMGGVMYTSTVSDLFTPAVRVVLTSGFLGGFTTYSAFNYETVLFLQQNMWGRALANVGVTILTCLAAGIAGIAAARRLVLG